MDSERINSLLRMQTILQTRLQEVEKELTELGRKAEYKLSPIDQIIVQVLDSIMTMDEIIAAVHKIKDYHPQYIRSSMSDLVWAGVVQKIGGNRGRGIKYCLKSKWEVINDTKATQCSTQESTQ